jgi:mRNA-degrading endonuclease toxin of MazEF toxin-antitoxin module
MWAGLGHTKAPTLPDSGFLYLYCRSVPRLTVVSSFSAGIAARPYRFPKLHTSVGVDEGLEHESWILCDNLVSLRKTQRARFVGSLARAKLGESDRALKMALALE